MVVSSLDDYCFLSRFSLFYIFSLSECKGYATVLFLITMAALGVLCSSFTVLFHAVVSVLLLSLWSCCCLVFLLVFLVCSLFVSSCLCCCLFVVCLFFCIYLRRAPLVTTFCRFKTVCRSATWWVGASGVCRLCYFPRLCPV